MLRHFLPVLLLSTLVACGGSNPTVPTPLDVPFSTTDLIVGTGTTVAAGTRVNFTYVGYLYSTTAADNQGTQFDSSTTSGSVTVTVGAGSVIAGVDQGLVGMKVGGRRKIVIPPSLGYGAAGNGPVPPNATLIFIIDLVSAQ